MAENLEKAKPTEIVALQPPRRDRVLMRQVIVGAFYLFFKFYGRLLVIGKENVPRAGPVILVGNHSSYLDPPLAWFALYSYRRPWGIAQHELWKNSFVAYCMDCIGTIPVHRGTADRAFFRVTLELLRRGDIVGMFPEGTRTPDGSLQPAQPGVALLIQKSGAQVVPAAILGTYEMLPRHRKSLRRVPLTIAFGEPITFPKEATREEIAATIMEKIAALLTANGRPTAPPKTG